MPATVLPALAAAEEAHRTLPMPPVAFALVAFAAFLLALGVLWSFRNTAAKVSDKQSRLRAAQAAAKSGGASSGHGGGH